MAALDQPRKAAPCRARSDPPDREPVPLGPAGTGKTNYLVSVGQPLLLPATNVLSFTSLKVVEHLCGASADNTAGLHRLSTTPLTSICTNIRVTIVWGALLHDSRWGNLVKARLKKVLAIALTLCFTAAACSNSNDSASSGPNVAGTTATTEIGATTGSPVASSVVATTTVSSVAATSPATNGGSVTTASPSTDAVTTTSANERNKNVPITGVPGVTDTEINYAAIGTRSGNPLGTCILDCYLDGIKAYFDFRNSEGGIFGRQLKVNQELDDELANNQVRSLDVISNNKSFGVFDATLLSNGWGDLDSAGIPTYTWGIQPADSANRSHNFPSAALLCVDCTQHQVPYAVKVAGAKHVGVIGYGITENSKLCVKATADSVKKYSSDIGADVAYTNDNITFGLPNGIGPEVSAMRDAGVDFIATCIDLNGMKTLGDELHRQGMDNVILYHPNTYDQQFVANAGGIFEGDFVGVGFLPFEAQSGKSTLGDFMTWMGKDGKTPTELSMVGWINASVAFEGLLAAGPQFDRAKVTAATNGFTSDTAGGLTKPINWTTAHTPYTNDTRPADQQGECSTMVRVKDGKFVTVAPAATPWMCWDSTAWSDPKFTAFG